MTIIAIALGILVAFLLVTGIITSVEEDNWIRRNRDKEAKHHHRKDQLSSKKTKKQQGY